jgi:hypothetical protein
MSTWRHFLSKPLGLILAGALLGCSRGPAQVGSPKLPVVPVSQPVQREVTDGMGISSGETSMRGRT